MIPIVCHNPYHRTDEPSFAVVWSSYRYHIAILFMLSSLGIVEIAHASNTSYVNSTPRVIINNGVIPEVSEPFLREVFSGKLRHWPDGQPITVIVFPSDHPLHHEFIQERLHMFPYQIERIWNKRIYSGRAVPPLIVSSIEQMHHAVANIRGAIGYLPEGVAEQEHRDTQSLLQHVNIYARQGG